MCNFHKESVTQLQFLNITVNSKIALCFVGDSAKLFFIKDIGNYASNFLPNSNCKQKWVKNNAQTLRGVEFSSNDQDNKNIIVHM